LEQVIEFCDGWLDTGFVGVMDFFVVKDFFQFG
jgi:hypothetical protein